MNIIREDVLNSDVCKHGKVYLQIVLRDKLFKKKACLIKKQMEVKIKLGHIDK
jgi:hypothetical protein